MDGAPIGILYRGSTLIKTLRYGAASGGMKAAYSMVLGLEVSLLMNFIQSTELYCHRILRRPSNLLWIAAIACMVLPFATGGGVVTDPSLPNQITIGELPEGLPHIYEGALEGGLTETIADAGMNNFYTEDTLPGGDVPTGGAPSPLFGATSWSQKMLRFEEFGTRVCPTTYPTTPPAMMFPNVVDSESCPDDLETEAFLAQEIWPEPRRMCNEDVHNPLEPMIEAFLGNPMESCPGEGRPPGEGWAHQRWDEFPPECYFESVQTGARANFGVRDNWQLHGFSQGEWGPGGLYHNHLSTGPGDIFGPGAGTCSGLEVRFHPAMPVQHENALWTFDGSLPPKLLMARIGEPVLFRHHNGLPIDPSANFGFGLHTITTHEHNGHNPAESDGFASSFFFPGQYYDYRWPMIVGGHDTVDATDPSHPDYMKCGRPEMDGSITPLRGDYREIMSTHWFHDHMLDFTAQNVYKGNAAMMNYYSSIDRGAEHINDGINLRLPSGTSLGWGNRDYDVNLVIADKAWTPDGQLWFNIFNLDGFVGDRLLTNWQYNPYLDVRARRYRFRILNGSVSRYYRIGLIDQSGNPVPFHMIANDGNIMEHAVAFDGTQGTQVGILPTQAIAERYDIVVDFSQFQPGDRLYMVNLLEHDNGKKPNGQIPLSEVVSGEYQAVQVDINGDGIADAWDGDPCVGRFLEFRVHAYEGIDQSMNPANYTEGGLKMLPRRQNTAEEIANARHRTFTFGRSSGTDSSPWTVKTDDGGGENADMRRLSAAPGLGDLEIWHIENGGGGWSHPIHIHFEEGQILSRGGEAPPIWERWARKDVYRIGTMDDSTDSVEVAIRFREFAGTYMEHCHNTQHEDHAMLLRWDIENPGEVYLMPNPMPSWEGVSYADTVALPTFRAGDGFGPSETSVAVAVGGGGSSGGSSGGSGSSGSGSSGSSCHSFTTTQIPAGVSLSWVNPTVSDGITIRRDGTVLTTLPGMSTIFVDTTATPGMITYEVINAVAGVDSQAIGSAITVQPQSLSELVCTPGLGVVNISWTLNDTYDSIQVLRNEILIETLPGTTTGYQDMTAPPGLNMYQIVCRSNLVDTAPVSCVQEIGVAGVADFTCLETSGLGDLFWANGGVYSQIRLERDGVMLGVLPGTVTTFLDTTLAGAPGIHTYTLIASTATQTLDPVTCTFEIAGIPAPLTGLNCALQDSCSATLLTSWTNNGFYDTIEVFIDGVPTTILTGTSVGDPILLPGPGQYTVAFRPVRHEIAGPATTCTVELLDNSAQSPTQLVASTNVSSCETTLEWTPQGTYGSLEILVNGILLTALDPAATAATVNLPDGGVQEVCLVATSLCGGTLPATCVITNCAAHFSRGDANADGVRSVGDTIFTLNLVFGMGALPSCPDSADANDDGFLDVSDAIFGLFSLFSQGPPPPAPYPGCGGDSTSDNLPCPTYGSCP